MSITREELIDILKTAAQTEKAMPSVKAPGYGNPWKNRIKSEASNDDADFIRPTISQEDIRVMEYAVDELLPLIGDIRTRRIVWSRSGGMGWKRICFQFHISRVQSWRLFNEGINDIFIKMKQNETK